MNLLIRLDNIFSLTIYLSYIIKINKKTHKTIYPGNPVIPEFRSFPPEIPMIEIAEVAFIVPCKIAAAITDFAFIVIYK